MEGEIGGRNPSFCALPFVVTFNTMLGCDMVAGKEKYKEKEARCVGKIGRVAGRGLYSCYFLRMWKGLGLGDVVD